MECTPNRFRRVLTRSMPSPDGVVQPGNLYFTQSQVNEVQQFMATRFSGAVTVTA